jgi:hypothetical protein
VLEQQKDHWLVRETIGALRRALARLDVTSRSLIALVDEGSCFAGTSTNWRWPATASTCWTCPMRPTPRPPCD